MTLSLQAMTDNRGIETIVWIRRLQGLVSVLWFPVSPISITSSLVLLFSVGSCPLVPALEIRL